MPPKNMTSVPRNSHMPRDAACFCCAMSAELCWRSGFWCSSTAGLSLNPHLLGRWNLFVVVRFPGHNGGFIEVESRWRRRRHPLQAGGVPGIGFRDLAIAHRPDEINHGEHIADGEDRCARRGKNIQDLEFLRILPIT